MPCFIPDGTWISSPAVTSLVSSPTRIVIGECRGAEAYTFLKALDTGHRGSFTSIHARSARDALDRLLGNALEAPHHPSETLLRRRIASRKRT